MPIDDYLAKYAERFKEGFPMYQLGRGRADEEIIEIIERCLSEGKTAYELGLVEDDEDIFY
jgi:hypothetical protein